MEGLQREKISSNNLLGNRRKIWMVEKIKEFTKGEEERGVYPRDLYKHISEEIKEEDKGLFTKTLTKTQIANFIHHHNILDKAGLMTIGGRGSNTRIVLKGTTNPR